MHLLLTDRLTCPRCGPTFGLVLLSRQLGDRRVLDGSLGCPNCRDRFPVCDGFGDLRPPPRAPLLPPEGEPPAPDAAPEDRVRALAAGLGAASGPGTTLLMGGAVELAPALARMLPDVEVVALDPRTARWPETPGVSRLVSGASLPFFGGMLRGVALSGAEVDDPLLRESLRVLAPGHRVVVLDPRDDSRDRLAAAGCSTIVEGPGMLAAGP